MDVIYTYRLKNHETIYSYGVLQHIIFGVWFMDCWESIGLMAGAARDEVLAWEGLCIKRRIANLISLTVLWVLWKEKNDRVFEDKQYGLTRLRDRWIYYFETILIGRDIISKEYFENVIDTLTLLVKVLCIDGTLVLIPC